MTTTLSRLFRSQLVRPAAELLCVGLLALGAGACSEVEQDDFVYQGGNSPDPTAIFEGSVLYNGPAPQCQVGPDGKTHVRGNIVLTMFEYTNPPAPEGTATSSLNLLVITGDDVFDVSDCALGGVPITRSVSFTWPRLPLYLGVAKDYQVRGFFDYDADFVPFFSVTRLPTEGDIIGAALNNPSDASQGFLRITLPPLEQAEKGIIRKGITVALGNQVRTERPAFKLDQNRKLAANSPFLINFGPGGLTNFRALTCNGDPNVIPDCGLTLLRLTEEDQPKLKAAGLELATSDPAKYAFTAEPVDVKTITPGVDLPVPDGKVDPHPFLAGLGVNLYTPMVVMQRIKSAKEVETKIPGVIMVGSVLQDATTQKPTKASYVNGAPIAVAPVGAVELVANDSACRVPYFPPGTPMLILNNRVAQCAELPTGSYATNVLAGIAGGTGMAVDPSVSENGQVVTGGRYSGQSWTIPNELANPLQVGAENVLTSQGVQETFVVSDPTPDVQGACDVGVLFPKCEGDVAGVRQSAAPGIPDVDFADCLPSYCCAAIAHLWEVPEPRLCPYDPATGIRTSPTTTHHIAANGLPVPNCLPFELPWQCAPAAPAAAVAP